VRRRTGCISLSRLRTSRRELRFTWAWAHSQVNPAHIIRAKSATAPKSKMGAAGQLAGPDSWHGSSLRGQASNLPRPNLLDKDQARAKTRSARFTQRATRFWRIVRSRRGELGEA
jgi:hypothetical protein